MILLILAASLAATPEDKAWSAVVERFEVVGRTAPQRDPALTQAAARLSKLALTLPANQVAELVQVATAVSEANGADPTPRALVISRLPANELPRHLGTLETLTAEQATHGGLSIAQDAKGQAALCLLLTHRRAEVAPFQRSFAKPPGAQKLCAKLDPQFREATAFVTRPDGKVDKLPMKKREDRFCAEVQLAANGRHTLEVLGRGPQGPEVTALFFVQIGESKNAGATGLLEPKDSESANVIFARINALRLGHGLSPLARDFELEQVAQAYASRMAKENFLAHISPDGEDSSSRVKRAGYRYQGMGENLGLGNGPLAAHFAIEHSPGHRENLLTASFTHGGVGFARNGRGLAVVVELLALPASPDETLDPRETAYRVLDAERSKRGLAPLARVRIFEELATAHARKALEGDTPKATVGGERLHDRVFAARDDVGEAAVDFFVTDSATLVTNSKNLGDPKNKLVGVGWARGDSVKYGADKLWIVIVYASPRD